MSAVTTEAVRLAPRLRALRPEATGLFDVAHARAWDAVDPDLLVAMRARAAALLGHPDGERATADSEPVRACVEFAEQFVLDVTAIGEAERDTLRRHFDEQTVENIVRAFFLTEFGLRLELVSGRLFDGPEVAMPRPPVRRSDDAGAALREAVADYADAVVRGRSLDPVVTELVRLRCARTHNCRMCRTLRLVDARAAGVDDTMSAAVDRYETSDLDGRVKAALRITDALITMPSSLSPSAVEHARTLLSEDELAELCLDVSKWSTQKVKVALGTDGAENLPLNEQGVSFFRFDDEGRPMGFSAVADSH
ncbi:carboxymuconolactone decarboxylase family protein [Blastococcus sp. CT_GayMR20]|uniref:carboxymuconolactone decarboxylase family protein n=1 Tax=Blastococcus sp. CT_GayMR20 TaxID=2559609 RepID=UPI00107423F0|nr:carboxymuconolactone decarboxylase family protein [Blastococcus sp. CT_GayMR20]TFV71980.1 carboxymuconolactone decarboxylase family protein [Blastococcus sp. CT_GayMR20]